MVTSRASLGSAQQRILVHHLGEKRLVERSPVHADADRLLVLDCNFDHGAEIVVVLAADPDVAGIDAVLGQGPGAFGKLLEQKVSVVMEVADDGDANALSIELLDDGRDRSRGFFVVDRDPHQLRAGLGQRGNLLDGGRNVSGIGIGHRLHHNWCIAADSHAANRACNGFSASNICHGEALF